MGKTMELGELEEKLGRGEDAMMDGVEPKSGQEKQQPEKKIESVQKIPEEDFQEDKGTRSRKNKRSTVPEHLLEDYQISTPKTLVTNSFYLPKEIHEHLDQVWLKRRRKSVKAKKWHIVLEALLMHPEFVKFRR